MGLTIFAHGVWRVMMVEHSGVLWVKSPDNKLFYTYEINDPDRYLYMPSHEPVFVDVTLDAILEGWWGEKTPNDQHPRWENGSLR